MDVEHARADEPGDGDRQHGGEDRQARRGDRRQRAVRRLDAGAIGDIVDRRLGDRERGDPLDVARGLGIAGAAELGFVVSSNGRGASTAIGPAWTDGGFVMATLG